MTDSAQIKQSPEVYLSYENSPHEANRGGPDVIISSWVIGWRQSLKIWTALRTFLWNTSQGGRNTSLLPQLWSSHERMPVLWEEALVRRGFLFCFVISKFIKCSSRAIYYFFCQWETASDKWPFHSCRLFKNKPPAGEEDEDPTQAGVNKATKGGIIYGDYLEVGSMQLCYHSRFWFIVLYISINFFFLSFFF